MTFGPVQLALSLMERNYEPGEYEYPAPENKKASSIPGSAGPVGYNGRVWLRKHAGSVLAAFTASRVFTPSQAGFSNIVLVELLVRNHLSKHQVQTTLGPVSAWIVDGMVHVDECCFVLHCRAHDPDEQGIPEAMRSSDVSHSCELAKNPMRLAEMFRNAHFGRYTSQGQSEKKGSHSAWLLKHGLGLKDALSQMNDLAQLAQDGSLVAERMLRARMQWMEGEGALRSGRFRQAIDVFAEALFTSQADGDPFGGWWPSDDGALDGYSFAVKAVLDSNPDSTEARLVQGRMLLQIGNAAESERVLSSAIVNAPNDVRLYAARSLVRGNQANWAGCLQDTIHCIELEPSQPIHYFWRSVALRNDKDSFDYEAFAEDINHFLAAASPEGRKVCQAWWDFSVVTLSSANLPKEDKMLAALCYAKKGFEAEKLMLPVLREHEKRSPSDGRKMAQLLVATEDRTGGALHEQYDEVHAQQHKQANEAFSAGRYFDAVVGYTALLKAPQALERHKLLSNRSAAFEKLCDYAGAEHDATECVELQPTWGKGYVRLARAKLGQMDGAGAHAAIQQALVLGVAKSELSAIEPSVQVLLATPVPTRCDPTQLACWKDVQFTAQVVVVDHRGSGSCRNLCNVLEKPVDTPTITIPDGLASRTIIVRNGSYTIRPFLVAGFKLQIIGDGDVTLIGAQAGEWDNPVLFNATGPGADLTLQNLTLKMYNQTGQQPAHCVLCEHGASVVIEHCSLEASAAAVVGNHGASIHMSDCRVPKGAAAGVLIDESKAVVRNCVFTDNVGMAAEARNGGSFELLNCTISGCLKQAAVVWMGGSEGLLDGCSISDCGQLRYAGAVFVTCGKGRVERCKIFQNRGDGVVMQASEKEPPSLRISNCLIASNGQHGISLYGGDAHVEENKIQENAVVGMSIHPHLGEQLVHLGRVRLVRNALSGNGTGMEQLLSDIVISGCDEDRMKRFSFDSNVSAPAIVGGRNAENQSLAEQFGLEFGFAAAHRKLQECASKKTYLIDTKTGLKQSRKGPLQRGMQTPPDAARMQSALPSEEDIQAVHFHKESLVVTQERQVRELDDTRDLPPIVVDNGILPPSAQRPSKKKVRNLKECSISDLAAHANRRAFGHVLYGTLCSNPIRCVSVMTVLEDGLGAGVRIAFYNLPGIDSPQWRMCFPKGLRIAIKEPFLKRYGVDAGIGIRVDHPSDVIFVSKICARRGCGVAEMEDRSLKSCGRCQLVSYCSKDCQLADWKAGHKGVCNPCNAGKS